MAEASNVDPATWRPGPTAIPGLFGPSVNPDRTKQVWDWVADKQAELEAAAEGGDGGEVQAKEASPKKASASKTSGKKKQGSK